MKKLSLPALSEETLSEIQLKVGWIQEDKKSSFSNFTKNKPIGTIRIGCFGDSLTHGDEVNGIYDYPGLLQDIFYANGYRNVEVINFGVGGYGFHQAFMLWEYLGKEYDLDCIILGPHCFQFDRDSTFNMQFSGNYTSISPNSFHSRYILDKNGVRLIAPIGRTEKELMHNYLRFIPHLNYLFFDRKAPFMLVAPLACLFSEKRLMQNPFYYKKDLNKEVRLSQELLLFKMANVTPQVILCNYDKDIVDWGKEFKKSNIFVISLYRANHFPYLAFKNHNSPSGNKLLAQQLFDCLTNKPESTLVTLKTESTYYGLTEASSLKKLKLKEYDGIAIEINSVKIGNFYDVTSRDIDACQPPNCDPTNNCFSDVASLLAIKNEYSVITEAFFLPLNFELAEGMPLKLVIHTTGGVFDYPLGNVKLLHPGVNIGTINLGKVSFDPQNQIIEFHKDSSVFEKMPFFGKNSSATILLNNTPILCGNLAEVKYKEIKFTSNKSRFFIMRGDGREILDTDALAQTGFVYLSLYKDQKKLIEITFAKFAKTNEKIVFGKIQNNLFTNNYN